LAWLYIPPEWLVLLKTSTLTKTQQLLRHSACSSRMADA
jgi:hypothetical protein